MKSPATPAPPASSAELETPEIEGGPEPVAATEVPLPAELREESEIGSAGAPLPPVARIEEHVVHLHGERRVDPYFWMRERDDPAVREHLEAENAFARAATTHQAPLRDELYRELAARLAEDDATAPYRKGDWLYFSRTIAGRQHRVHCRSALDGTGEQVLLDLNALAPDGGYIALGDFEVSDDGALLAYTLDRRGFREYTLEVLDLERGELLPDRIERVTSLAWAADGVTLLYATEDAAKRPHRIHRHALRTVEPDPLVYEETDERFRVGVHRTRSGAFLVLTSASHTATEQHLIPAAEPTARPRLVARRESDHEYYLDDAGDELVLRSNRGGRHFALYEAAHDAAGPEEWRELLRHDPDTMLERLDAFATHLVVSERDVARGGLPRFRVLDSRRCRARGADRDTEVASSAELWSFISFPEPAYDAQAGPNEEFESSTFRFVYQSMTTPPTVMDHDLRGGGSVVVKREPVPGFDPSVYSTERIEAIAADGTRIPVSLVRRRDTALPAPILIKGYGAYGLSYPPVFDRNAVSLLDRGMVVAIAHVRGGGDLGQRWHDAGRMASKRNTFSDFVAAAEALVANGVAAPGRIALAGGSAGGLLVGAVVNLRPDLFAAAIALVPFVDVVGTMSDPSLPLTVGEYEEWGNPAIEEQYRWIRAYSPYDNVEAKAYPAMLVRTSFWDSQVMYWEPAKYVAKLRATKTDRRPLLFLTNLDAGGHGGFAGRYDRLRDTAFDFAFLLESLGL